MNTRGTLTSLSISFPSRRAAVTFEVAAEPAELEKYKDMDLDIDFDRHKEKRSLNANSYFHLLCDKLRQKLGISMAECKNHLIASYGQIEYIGEAQAIIKTNVPPEKMREVEYLHTWPIKVDAEGACWYRVYRGSHTYDSAEMAKLIDGTVQECKAQGIETMTPMQIKIMVEMWGQKKTQNARAEQQELKL